ncbi:MAG: NAD(P)-dependent alcohol dehydrogenase [Chloroflexota bacterium]
MKAIVYTQYGSPDVLRLTNITKPTLQANDVLIRTHATGVNAADWRLLRADPLLVRLTMGLFKPKYPVLGSDVAGEIEAVGSAVTQFRPGDAVYGDLSGVGLGGFAEYVRAPEHAITAKPSGLTFAEAAAVPMAAITALQGLRDHGQIQPGQQVLINGASGGVGTFAVQIAKAFGAEVTAVCSTTKIDLARSLGADHIVDYTQEDFIQNNMQYDLILAANGSRALRDYERALAPQGRYVMVGGSMSQIFQAMLLGPLRSKKGGKTFKSIITVPNQQDLWAITELIEMGKVKPVIDRCFPLVEVPAALRYLETGRARAKVVITMR